jgi:hypothetical protein
MGVDPYKFVDVEDEEYLIKAAMLRKAIELRNEEIKTQAVLIGEQIAQFMGFL